MRDEQVDQALNALDSLWPNSKAPLDRGARAVWGAELSRHDHGEVMGAMMALLRSSKWRPSLAELLDKMREQRRARALAESKRLALAPSPEEPRVDPERFKELSAKLRDATRPTRLEHMAELEPRRAVGGVGERRKWGAIALQVLCERLGELDEAAADVLDEVARRARGAA